MCVVLPPVHWLLIKQIVYMCFTTTIPMTWYLVVFHCQSAFRRGDFFSMDYGFHLFFTWDAWGFPMDCKSYGWISFILTWDRLRSKNGESSSQQRSCHAWKKFGRNIKQTLLGVFCLQTSMLLEPLGELHQNNSHVSSWMNPSLFSIMHFLSISLTCCVNNGLTFFYYSIACCIFPFLSKG